ncbi:MAG TPA: single-stranded DNA-binding protein [Jatrophihabitans sp.]|jgi:single-strand DNA-binding protein|nr:single-stranded DNA-binding protein [Jatrophihabitans sp.]
MNTSTDAASPDNQVFLRGRLAGAPLFRDLPSGDRLAVFRVTVARPPGQRARVDSIECTATKARTHKTLARASVGDDLEVSGSLHRRFWRTASGVASRYAVEVETVRLMKTGRRAGASAGRKRASG